MALKTYVLGEHMAPTAPIYIQISATERMRIDKLPLWRPYLQYTYYDNKDGKNKTIRLKLNSNTPYQDEQIEKEKIPANERYSDAERDAAKFVNGVCATNNEVVQKFLEVSPHFEGFDGKCDAVLQWAYKLHDKSIAIKNDNDDFKKRLRAANKIAGLDLKDAQDLLIRIYGSQFEVPYDLESAQNALVSFMDGSYEALDEILKEDTTIDDEIRIIVAKLMRSGKISFNAIDDQVAFNKAGQWIPLKQISNEYTQASRENYFAEFLSSPSGRLVLNDLRAEVEGKNVKPVVVSQPVSTTYIQETVIEVPLVIAVEETSDVPRETIDEIKEPTEQVKRPYNKRKKKRKTRTPKPVLETTI